jgi:hypothetical protein
LIQGWLGFVKPMFDVVPPAGMATQHRCWTRSAFRQVNKLNAVIGEHDIDFFVRHCLDESVGELFGGG